MRAGVAALVLALLPGLAGAEGPGPPEPAEVRLTFRPDRPLPAGEDPVEVARHRLLAGNAAGAASVLEDWMEGRTPDLKAWGGRRRMNDARFLLGWIQWRLGHPNLASAWFTRVRLSGGPLAAEAAFWEARADHARGRHGVAARECASLRATFPESPRVDDCLFLEGRAWAAAGAVGSAKEAFEAYLIEDPDGPDAESARLHVALGVAKANPRAGIPLLQSFALDYGRPTTRARALRALADLRAAGYAADVPDDLDARMRHAMSARRAKQYEEAWELFTRLREVEDPRIQAWVDSQAEGFVLRTRRWKELAGALAEDQAANPNPATLWDLHRALARAGAWREAAEVGEQGLVEWPDHSRWSHAREAVGRAWLLAGDGARALPHLDAVGRTGGSVGRDARFLAALAALHSKTDDARARLDRVLAEEGDRVPRARYWRGRLLLEEGRADAARADLEAVRDSDPGGWYGLLARMRLEALGAAGREVAGPTWMERDGRWPWPAHRSPPDPKPVPVGHAALARVPRLPRTPIPVASDGRIPAWTALAWHAPAPPYPVPAPLESSVSSPVPSEVAPESVRAGRWHDPVAARVLLTRFVAENEDLWPDLPAALAFVQAGLPDFAGEIMVPIWRELIDPEPSGDPARATRIRAIQLDARSSRELWACTHAWGPLSAVSQGLDRLAADEQERRDALALGFPVAWPDVVWPAARGADVDPLWLLALMRAESYFHTHAVSPTGAVGLLQVMPSTGALIAHDLGIDDFAPRDLFEPVLAARFGAWYLSRLRDRFGGSLVLATAAYNAGPEAVSGWWGGGASGLEADAFVELIPVDETRTYVARVLGGYARYVEAHAPPGARVALALQAGREDPAGISY